MAAWEGPCVVWWSGLFDRSGYAEEARDNILTLQRAGVCIHADPRRWEPWQKPLATGDAERLERLIALDLPPRFVHVMHSAANHFRREPGAVRHIGRTMWETDGLPVEWVERCNEMDEVWVPSDFNVETFAGAGVAPEKLHKVPEGLSWIEHYDPGVEPFELAGTTGFVFLSVFTWQRRKGWDVLLRAYLEEFDRDEDVTLALLIAPFNKPVSRHLAQLRPFITDELRRDPARSARIVAFDLEPGTAGMPRLYRAADAYVQPSRGEGWGRPLMEAMAMGVPTIGTRWSGNLEFMNDENSYLVDYELSEVPELAWREWPGFRGQRWAEPSVEHLRALMRRVTERSEEARAKGARARKDILERCRSEQVAEAMLARLREVDVEPPSPRHTHPPRQPSTEPGPEEARRRFDRGMEHAQSGRLPEARRELLQAVVLCGDDRAPAFLGDAHLALAHIEYERGRDGHAALHLRYALDLAPGLGEAYALFARVLERLGLVEASLRAYRRSLETSLTATPRG